MRRQGWLWPALLAACTIAPADSGAGTSRSFHEVPIAHIPVGPGADRISRTGCRLCTGAPFIGRNETIYFYDTNQNNLKLITGSGDSTHVTVLAAPVLGPHDARPTDGAEGPDGTLYLLADPGEGTPNVTIYYRPRSGGEWQKAHPLAREDFGWPAGTAEMHVTGSGEVEVSGFDRRNSPAVVIGDGSGVLPVAERRKLGVGWIGISGHRVRASGDGTAIASAAGTAHIGAPGTFIGGDADDNIYILVPTRTFGIDVVQRYSPEGELLASGTTRLYTGTILSGKGMFQVTRDGDVYQFRMSWKGLAISRWTTD
jgi:hypothetical protein